MTLAAPVARDAFITAMRSRASSVTVVTTDGPAGRHGATVSAFSSLSADPPSVLVCLRADSRIATAVAQNGVYCVNILPDDQAALANRFAGAMDAQLGDRFDDLALAPGDYACPQLPGATSFHCELARNLTHGSHMIAIGHVIEITQGTALPLTYMDGGFHSLHPQVNT
jgi:flavin reductase